MQALQIEQGEAQSTQLQGKGSFGAVCSSLQPPPLSLSLARFVACKISITYFKRCRNMVIAA